MAAVANARARQVPTGQPQFDMQVGGRGAREHQARNTGWRAWLAPCPVLGHSGAAAHAPVVTQQVHWGPPQASTIFSVSKSWGRDAYFAMVNTAYF